MVEGSIDLENVTVTTVLGPRLVAPDAGVTDVTIGCVVSCAAAAVKLNVYPGHGLPAKSSTLKIWPMIVALAGSGERGVNVPTAPFTVKLPANCAPFEASVNTILVAFAEI